MPNRSDLIREARSWLGTPWRDSGAIKGVGCNCLGFLIGVARNCGLSDLGDLYKPYEGFAMPPDPLAMVRGIREHMVKIKIARPGDVLLFDLGAGPRHVALLTEPGMIIHAHQTKGKVVEQGLAGLQRQTWGGGSNWYPRGVYAFPGVN
jgi:NlpC/P60 family putative phage cell wall peptidase